MYDPFDFIGGILLGTFIGSMATLIYHVRQIRQETRQNYVRLSLAQSEVATLERTLEIHRRRTAPDFPKPLQNAAVLEREPSDDLPLIPPWIDNCEDSSGGRMTSERSQSRGRET